PHSGDGVLRAPDVAAGIVGAVVKDPVSDAVVWQDDLETVVRERDGWRDVYRAARAGAGGCGGGSTWRRWSARGRAGGTSPGRPAPVREVARARRVRRVRRVAAPRLCS